MSGDIAAALIAVGFSLVTGAVLLSWRLSGRLHKGEARFAQIDLRLDGLEAAVVETNRIVKEELQENSGSSMKDAGNETNRLLGELLLRLDK